jgi:hypothetical protein
MPGPKVTVAYTTDSNTTGALRVEQRVATAFGLDPAPANTPPLPRGLEPRYFYARLPNGRRTKIVCPNPASPMWTGADVDIPVPNWAALLGGSPTAADAAATAVIEGRIGEKRLKR